jgi:hypothetical protein
MKNVVLVLLCFWGEVGFAQELTLCQKINDHFYYFDIDYNGFDVKKTIEGNLMILARAKQDYHKPLEKTLVLIKIDTTGNLILKKKLTVNFNGKVFINTPDSGFIVAGFKNKKNTKYRDARKVLQNGWIAKFDKNANILWEKEIEGFERCIFKAIEMTKDDSFIAIADIESIARKSRWLGNRDTDIGIFKINQEGEIITQDFYGGGGWDSFKKMEKLSDGSFELLLSLRTNVKRIETQSWLMKFNPNGIFQSQKVGQFENGKDIFSYHTSSVQRKIGIGSITIGLYNYYLESCFYQGFIEIKTPKDSLIKTFCDEKFESIAYSNNIYIGGYLMNRLKSPQFPWDVKHIGLIKKIDEKGNVLWEKKISDPEISNIKVKSIIPISQNHFWIVAIASNSIFGESIYIYKLKDD